MPSKKEPFYDAEIYAEATIAAILTVGVLSSDGTSPKHAVQQYKAVLQELRQAGYRFSPTPS
jgi:hypothetical protein